MKPVLVACEESQAVTIALRSIGVRAYSADILPALGGHPEWHIQGDVRELVEGGAASQWSAVLAFPPCTHLAVSGARWWPAKRADGRQAAAVDFFLMLAECEAPRVAVENPIGLISTVWRKPDQIVQPWMFGHGETKATCLWLRNLPKLTPTNIVEGRSPRVHMMPDSKGRARRRSRTYTGLAEAMAAQWGELLR